MTGYRLTLKSGAYVVTRADGSIRYDSERHYLREATPDWRIIGIGSRFNSRQLATLAECADTPTRIGQGWVHDYDHGARRVWCMPKHRRVVRVERLVTE